MKIKTELLTMRHILTKYLQLFHRFKTAMQRIEEDKSLSITQSMAQNGRKENKTNKYT